VINAELHRENRQWRGVDQDSPVERTRSRHGPPVINAELRPESGCGSALITPTTDREHSHRAPRR
jgi:hypothetical protein